MVWRGREAGLVGKASVLYRCRGHWSSRANGSTKGGCAREHGNSRSGGKNRSKLVRRNLLLGENPTAYGPRSALRNPRRYLSSPPAFHSGRGGFSPVQCRLFRSKASMACRVSVLGRLSPAIDAGLGCRSIRLANGCGSLQLSIVHGLGDTFGIRASTFPVAGK